MGKYRNIAKLIPVGSVIECACNSGAKKLKIMGFKNLQGAKKRRRTGGVGNVAVVSVKKGKNQLRKKKFYALIVRQKYPYLRKTGPIMGRVAFTDNAAVLLNDDTSLRKSVVKGVVAKEVTEIRKYSEISAVFR